MPQFAELLSNAHVFRIVKENLQKKNVQVRSVAANEIVRVGISYTCTSEAVNRACSCAVAVTAACLCTESRLADADLVRSHDACSVMACDSRAGSLQNSCGSENAKVPGLVGHMKGRPPEECVRHPLS